MKYVAVEKTKAFKFPKIGSLKALSEDLLVYPVSTLGIRQQAERMGLGRNMTDFLDLISDKLVFANRDDFLDYCLLLERLLKEEVRQTAW